MPPPSPADTPVDMQLVDSIVEMVEVDHYKNWAYDPAHSDTPASDPLAQAQRFMAAQSFLLSWQNGKVPTNWRRPRAFADFANESPAVIGAAKAVAHARAEARNDSANVRIRAFRHSSDTPAGGGGETGVISAAEIADLKDAYAKFSSDIYDINTALSNVTSTIADITLRTQALSEQGLR